MKILAIESSAITASVAVVEEDKLLAQYFQNSGLTHSATLMPMIDNLLKNTELSLKDIDVIAFASGPGSFTGIRIGVATAKGLAWPRDILCAPCSTLESMAWQCAHINGEICCVMDARRNQVYCARFLSDGSSILRLSEDNAISLDELCEEVNKSGNPQLLIGDGATACCKFLQAAGLSAKLAPPHLLYQTAWGVARMGLELAHNNQLIHANIVVPQYHRLSQAERERIARLNN